MRIWILFLALALTGCGQRQSEQAANRMSVSILPLRFVAEAIVGDDFQVSVLVPPGSSPETWEPSPSAAIALSDAELILTTGLMDFERRLLASDELPLVDLSEGIELIAGHLHDGHAHGADPHIWLSPRNLKQMGRTLYRHIALLYPDSTKYHDRLVDFELRMDTLDARLHLMAGLPKATTGFIIYHPALSYLARDYGLRQIALEHDGKEPSAEQLKQVIEMAHSPQVAPMVFYQRESSPAVVETIAAEIGVEVVQIDPLAEQVDSNLRSIMELITSR